VCRCKVCNTINKEPIVPTRSLPQTSEPTLIFELELRKFFFLYRACAYPHRIHYLWRDFNTLGTDKGISLFQQLQCETWVPHLICSLCYAILLLASLPYHLYLFFFHSSYDNETLTGLFLRYFCLLLFCSLLFCTLDRRLFSRLLSGFRYYYCYYCYYLLLFFLLQFLKLGFDFYHCGGNYFRGFWVNDRRKSY